MVPALPGCRCCLLLEGSHEGLLSMNAAGRLAACACQAPAACPTKLFPGCKQAYAQAQGRVPSWQDSATTQSQACGPGSGRPVCSAKWCLGPSPHCDEDMHPCHSHDCGLPAI